MVYGTLQVVGQAWVVVTSPEGTRRCCFCSTLPLAYTLMSELVGYTDTCQPGVTYVAQSCHCRHLCLKVPKFAVSCPIPLYKVLCSRGNLLSYGGRGMCLSYMMPRCHPIKIFPERVSLLQSTCSVVLNLNRISWVRNFCHFCYWWPAAEQYTCQWGSLACHLGPRLQL